MVIVVGHLQAGFERRVDGVILRLLLLRAVKTIRLGNPTNEPFRSLTLEIISLSLAASIICAS